MVLCRRIVVHGKQRCACDMSYYALKCERKKKIMKNMINSGVLSEKIIGIAGFGHLGSSIAFALIAHGFPKERLMISCGGRDTTLARIRSAGLGDCIVDTASLVRRANIILLAARPQDLGAFYGLSVKSGALVLSFMAGVALETLHEVFSCDICRVMCSGPDTIAEGLGIGAAFPQNAVACTTLASCGLDVLDVSGEEEIDAFTVAICLPPILLNVRVSQEEKARALKELSQRYPVCIEISAWIDRVLAFRSQEERSATLAGVSTKGGVTESMTTALKKGMSFSEAIATGLAKNNELRCAMRINILAAACSTGDARANTRRAAY